MELNSIEGVVRADNIKSIKLLARNNFNKKSVFKEQQQLKDEVSEMIVYELTNNNKEII
ncbi:GNAT family N-acetyltransferase [Alkaliphilus peptidifermentans]|uniref:GNAT family N-acetyltransferase n=1 Tax=Alkaliphilus peptidifermentans TaxID=426129 RepID=UPI0015A1D882|nr:hypothetical protein [Alkaliphilus peptidifermentans]